MDLPPQLGRYRIDGMLGSGGMGAVYRAFDTALERPVALKIMLPGEASPKAAERMRREAKAAALLDHPNVVRVYDVAEIEGRLCIAMELLEGASIAAHIERGSIDPLRAERWLQQTASALGAAHAAGIVHRDIKPANIHVCTDDTVKILDFGIVQRQSTGDRAGWETLSDHGAIVGTPHYMAPEQLAQLPSDGRADQFSWGVVAYELFTGQLPWPEGTVLQVLTAVLEDSPTPAAELSPDVDAAVSTVIARAMQKDPEDRYPTIAEAAAALEAAVVGAGQTLLAKPATLPPIDRTAAAPATSSRSRWGLVVVAGVVLIGGLVFFSGRSRPVPEPKAPAPAATAIRAITELPLPRTDDTKALAAYRQGLQRYRGGDRSTEDLEHAVELDPTLAAAHMRLAVRKYTFEPDAARAHAAQAFRFADDLSARDRHYLAMVKPMVLSQPRDEAAWVTQAERAVHAYPEDAELHFMRGWAFASVERKDEARGAFRRATELDPGFAWAWQFLGESQAAAGDLAAAQASFDACLEHLPVAHTCRMLRSIFFAAAGRCEAHREDVGQLYATTPTRADTLERYAFALAAEGAGEAAIEDVGDELARVGPPWRAHRHRAKWHAHRGDFPRALEALDAWDDAVTDRDESRRSEAAALRVLILLEASDSTAAGRYALDYLQRREAWMKNTGAYRVRLGLDAVPAMLEALRVAGADERDDLRARWLSEGPPGDASVAWLHRQAAFAQDAASAEAALEAAPEGAPPTFAPLSYITALHGHVLHVAGRADEALPWLKQAVQECRRFKWPILHARAELELGMALEATGDPLGACRSYDGLLARWSAETSRTAAEAKRRRSTLPCP